MAENDTAMTTTADVADPTSREVLLAFYSRLYPFKAIFTWLAHSHTPALLFTNREFAFTLERDIYSRYNSFQTAEDFKKRVLELVPTRFEIGPVYNAKVCKSTLDKWWYHSSLFLFTLRIHAYYASILLSTKPRDRKTLRQGALTPLSRELVFDIDMTDYDAIRTCCSSAQICRRCWTYIAAAVDVLDHALRNDFGYNLLLWVYSGRRGIHCWVSDEEAMKLTDDQRKAIMGWLEVIKGGANSAKQVSVRVVQAGVSKDLHPSLKTSLDMLNENHFVSTVIEEQDCFRQRTKGWEPLLELIPDKDIVSNLRKKWESEGEKSSLERWDDLREQVRTNTAKDTPRRTAMKHAMEDIVLQYTYPRLDSEVTKHRNHLLKAPFVIHPGTVVLMYLSGRICIPIDPARVNEFDPEKVPTVGSLLSELDSVGREARAAEDGAIGWEQTSLRPYVEMLDEHSRRILQAERERKMVESRRDTSW